MALLILGLLLFLGPHAVRIVAEPWRRRTIERVGVGTWKGVYAVVVAVGLVAIAWGYGQARTDPVVLWTSPAWTRHLAALLTAPAFVLLVAAYVPGNAIRARLHHPMVLSVKLWAIAHLLANGTLADLLLFGSFLAWAVADFAAARRRDRAERVVYPPGRAVPTAAAVVIGLVAWALFAVWGHAALIGVRPFG